MSYVLMYLIMILDSVNLALGLGAGFMLFGSLISLAYSFDIEDFRFLNSIKKGFIVSAVMLTMFALTPTTKEAAIIIVVPTVVNKVQNSEEISKIPDELASLANEWLQELKPKKKVEDEKN